MKLHHFYKKSIVIATRFKLNYALYPFKATVYVYTDNLKQQYLNKTNDFSKYVSPVVHLQQIRMISQVSNKITQVSLLFGL